MSERVASDTASTMKIEIPGAGRLMRPIKTVKVQHTPIEDRAPVKVYLLPAPRHASIGAVPGWTADMFNRCSMRSGRRGLRTASLG
ncbi:hypothetical protein ACU4GD_40155 [Cupriavidus basilensis]